METPLFNQTEISGKFSSYLALGSFAGGTVILILYLLFPQREGLLVLGFFYVLFAALFNSMILLHLLYLFCISSENREALAIKMLLLLANIPIAILYFYIAMY